MFAQTVLSIWLVGALARAGVAPPHQLSASQIPLYGLGGEPNEFDVNQALTPDCWLEATLAAVVRINSKTITQMLHDNGDGTVTVSLYDPLTLLAVNPPSKVKKLQFSQMQQADTSTTTWVQVIQDALNPLVNGSIFNGRGNLPQLALSAIYGEAGVYSTCDQLLSLASRAAASPMIFVTDAKKAGPLVQDHAYTLENTIELDSGTGVRMRNPWGDKTSLGHGELDASNVTAQAQCVYIAHLTSVPASRDAPCNETNL
jgi:hypothetical protein